MPLPVSTTVAIWPLHDIGRNALIEREGWINIHVVAEHSKAFILHRVREAFARRDASPFST